MKQYYIEPDKEKYIMADKERHEYKQFQDLFLIDIIWYDSYEITRESFFPWLIVYRLPISQIIWWLLLGMGWFGMLFSALFDPLQPFFFGLFFACIFLVSWSWLIYSWIQSLKRIAVYKKTLGYLDTKDSIIQEKERLELSIENDVNNSWIDVIILDDIKRFISSILSGYETIKSSHEYIQNHRGYFWAVSKEWQAVINREFQWIINYSLEFTTLVQSWISHHAIELSELEQQIQSQSKVTENEGGKVALEISRISLQEHLNRLEKICV